MSTKRDEIEVDAQTGALHAVRLQKSGTPATPPGGEARLYLDLADGVLKVVDASGTVTPVGTVLLSPASQQAGAINVSGEIAGADVKAGGLTGATGTSRYVGAVAGSPPATGTFAVGDYVVDNALASFWICTFAGSPGTWIQVGAAPGEWDGAGPGPTTTEGDMVYRHSGTLARLGLGADQKQMLSDGTDPYWGTRDLLTTGDVADPELIFAAGEPMWVYSA
jgi:hypothetical protein